MKDILVLYDKVKNIEGVDRFLIDSYIKVILKELNCETIEDLVNLLVDQEKKKEELYHESLELSQKMDEVLSDKKKLLEQKGLLLNELSKKNIRILVMILGVLGVAAGIAVSFFSIQSFIAAIVLVFSTARFGMNLRNKNYVSCNNNEAQLNVICELERDISSLENKNTFALLRLEDSINDITKIMDKISTFLETYASSKEETAVEELVSEVKKEEVVEEDIREKGRGRTLC